MRSLPPADSRAPDSSRSAKALRIADHEYAGCGVVHRPPGSHDAPDTTGHELRHEVDAPRQQGRIRGGRRARHEIHQRRLILDSREQIVHVDALTIQEQVARLGARHVHVGVTREVPFRMPPKEWAQGPDVQLTVEEFAGTKRLNQAICLQSRVGHPNRL